MKAQSLYEEFIDPEVINSQVSWTKWHIMNRKGVNYSVAEQVLYLAVEAGKLQPEDYYHRFVVIR